MPDARWVKFAIVPVAIVIVAAALRAAAVVVLPLVGSLVIAVMLWPLHMWLRRWMSRWLSAGLCTGLVALAILMTFGWTLYAGSELAARAESDAPRYIERYQELRESLTSLGVPASSLPEIDASAARSDGFWSSLDPELRDRIFATLSGGLRSGAGIAAALILTTFLAYLALLEGDEWARWVGKRISPGQAPTLGHLVLTWSKLTRRYFLSKTVSGVIAAAATGILLWAVDVPLIPVWMALSFLLNFIPNIGAIISAIPPTLLAFAEHGLWQGATVAVGLFVIETIVGNLVDPAIQGNLLRLTTFVVIASLLIWGWLWGIAGAVLAPVLTAGIVAAWQHMPGARRPSARAAPA